MSSRSANIIFANNLEPDQDRQNVGPDLDPNCLTLSGSVPERVSLKKLILKKSVAEDNKSMKNYPAFKELKELKFHLVSAYIGISFFPFLSVECVSKTCRYVSKEIEPGDNSFLDSKRGPPFFLP